ncbi:MAG: SpoIIE family protein phosphatase [Balneolaceae bacterium]|nr:SpoIIE family protein phosphatase [Balneolaceae bacterium]
MDIIQQIFFTTLAASFGILHLILYLYNRKFKSNLFFSIFLFFYALSVFFDYQAFIAPSGENLVYLRLHRAVMPYSPLFALIFLYYAFDFKIPKYFWGLTTAVVLAGIVAVIEPVEYFGFVQIMILLIFVEAIRVFIMAIRKKRNDAWIITTGFILLFLFSLYDIFMDLDLIMPVAGILNAYPFGFVGLIICASIYLARDFARANQTILEQEREAREKEVERKILEAEDQRKAKELEEAREVQLSLLPQCITGLQNYDFCFEMHPASEVGGDYYDYSISDSGELSIAIGDATNHGMKAGIMVSIMKSLFISHIDHMEIKEFLNHCSGIIKQMKLKNLFMALMIVKIDGRKLRISSAGIPPLLIFRKESGKIEEIRIKGMPLGSVDSFPYQTVETELNEGDVVLMMTDGLAELFNEQRESFGTQKIKKTLLENSENTVNDIVETLFSEGKKWRRNSKQNDDITFVSFRYKPANKAR